MHIGRMEDKGFWLRKCEDILEVKRGVVAKVTGGYLMTEEETCGQGVR